MIDHATDKLTASSGGSSSRTTSWESDLASGSSLTFTCSSTRKDTITEASSSHPSTSSTTPASGGTSSRNQQAFLLSFPLFYFFPLFSLNKHTNKQGRSILRTSSKLLWCRSQQDSPSVRQRPWRRSHEPRPWQKQTLFIHHLSPKVENFFFHSLYCRLTTTTDSSILSDSPSTGLAFHLFASSSSQLSFSFFFYLNCQNDDESIS